MKNKIYLTGATGRVGQKVLNRIPDAIPLVRKESGLPNEIVVDFSDVEKLSDVLKDAAVLIHIAGSVKTYDKEELWESNCELTKRLMRAAPENARVVFASTISIYGKKLSSIPADENTPVNPDTEYAKSKYEAEKRVMLHKDHVILRIGTVYGPEFEDYFYILRLLEKGKMDIIGNGKNRVPFVNIIDVADAFASAVSKGSGTYLIVGECRTQEEIYRIACKELKVDAPKGRMPVMIADFAARFVEIDSKLFGKKAKITREHVAILSSDRCFNCNKARRELGFIPISPEDGIKDMVGAYDEAKRLSTESRNKSI